MPERLLALVRSFLLGFHKLCAKERGSDLREQPNYVTYYKQANKDDLLRAASATIWPGERYDSLLDNLHPGVSSVFIHHPDVLRCYTLLFTFHVPPRSICAP